VPGELVRAAAAGDAGAWEKLVRRFSSLVWSVARGHGLATADAEDVFQVTWLRLAQHIGRLHQPERVGAWLATTARHESLRVIRATARLTPLPDLEEIAPPLDAPTPEEETVIAEDSALESRRSLMLWHAFEEMGDRCRVLLRVLMSTPPLSYAEVGALLGIPVGSIGPTRARCLQRLRDLLELRGITGTAGGS
jgi:RNA polymerase sigma factor (sigma-70 family)